MLHVEIARQKGKAWMCYQEIGCAGVAQRATSPKGRLVLSVVLKNK